MTARKAIDKAIMKVIGDHPEITIKNLMFKLDKGGLTEGRTMRAVANHVYDLRKEGVVTQIGQSNTARYILTSQLEPVTEQAHQHAEGKRREATTTSAGQLGECDLIEVGGVYVMQPRDTPAERSHEVVQPEAEQKIIEQPAPTPPPERSHSVVVLDNRAPGEPPFDARVSAIAEHIGTTVTLTIGKLIEDALREKETTIKMQSQHIKALDSANEKLHNEKQADAAQIEQLRRELAEQDQLYNELDTRYNSLKKQIGQLAA